MTHRTVHHTIWLADTLRLQPGRTAVVCGSVDDWYWLTGLVRGLHPTVVPLIHIFNFGCLISRTKMDSILMDESFKYDSTTASWFDSCVLTLGSGHTSILQFGAAYGRA